MVYFWVVFFDADFFDDDAAFFGAAAAATFFSAATGAAAAAALILGEGCGGTEATLRNETLPATPTHTNSRSPRRARRHSKADAVRPT